MKKLLFCATALASFLFASCQQENLEPAVKGNKVTYTVEAPGALQTKAIADGMNVNELIYEVWLTSADGTTDLSGAQKLYQASTQMVHEGGKNKATVTLDLVNDQHYTVLFWAQVAEANAYVTDELTAVTYAKGADEYLANDESLAAFYAVDFVNDGTAANSTVYLKRPFAQVNLCTLNERAPENNPSDYNIVLVNSKMTLNAVPTTFNVATKDVDNYVTMTFDYAAVPGGVDKMIEVNDQEYYYAGMNYVFAGANLVLTYDIQTSLNGSANLANINNIIYEVPVKENHRTNIVGNLLTSKTDYEIIVDADFNEPSQEVLVTEVTNSEDLQVALVQNLEHIIIDLSTNSVQTRSLAAPVEYTIPVNHNTFGGESTKSITINANGNILNFVYSNGDNQSINCTNPEAKIIINDATLTNSGKNNGPWDRHNIVFRHAVELNNVTSDKAIALLGNAKLTNVAISDVHPNNSESYGLWITPLGQTVELDGVTITPSANKKTDRAITINEQYYTANSAPIVLNVKNSTFVSQKKAAILVKSKVATTINWGEGNNISQVAADPVNAVWVDESYADSYDLVTVEGAFKALEGTKNVPTAVVTTIEGLQTAIEAAKAGDNHIAINANLEGNVTIRQVVGVNLLINGNGKNFDGTFYLEGGNQGGQSPETLTFKNINFVHESGKVDFISADDAKTIGKRYAHNVTVEDCTFTGTVEAVAMRYRQTYNMTVQNVTANGLHSLIQATGGEGIYVNNATVDSKSGISIGTATNVNIKNSNIKALAYGVRANGTDGNSSLKIENTTINAAQPVIVREMKGEKLYSVFLLNVTLNTEAEYQVVFTNGDDDAEYVAPTGNWFIAGAEGVKVFPTIPAKIGETKYNTLAEAVAAVQDGETIKIAGIIEEGTIKLPSNLKNVTFQGEEGVVLKNMTISAADGNSYNYQNLTFNGLTFNNSRILLTGWRNDEELIENLTVTNCTFMNLDDNTNTAPVHINKDAAEAVKGFTFTNNVIDGATGGSKSGVYAQLTGNVVFTGNVINNVSFRPYVIQITTDDGIADNFVVTGNTFSGSSVGRAQGLGNNDAGTDLVNLVVSENIFKGITGAQQICYWNFNAETTTANLSHNYYDINIANNPSKIYYNSAAQSVEDLVAMGVYPIYTELNADGTINTNSLSTPTQE